MEAIRIHRVITDDRIAESKPFIGRRVEIIILPEENEKENNTISKENSLIALHGSCPNLIDGMEFQNKMRSEWER